jgi:HAD superfamily hydrolase (TIGR01509 family)
VLLLDLGNVTVRLRAEGFMGRFRAACDPALLPADSTAVFSDPAYGHHAFERGRIDSKAMHQTLQRTLGLTLDHAAWLELWNDYFEPNRPMEALIARLRGQARIWGLSNTNAVHLEFLRRNYRVLGAFEGITASHEVAAAKPEAAIYAAALRSLGVEGPEVLYLDDVPAYLEGAAAFGIRGFHYTFNDAELREALRLAGFELPPLDGASGLSCG